MASSSRTRSRSANSPRRSLGKSATGARRTSTSSKRCTRLEDLETWSKQGPPLRMGLGMFAGQKLVAGTRELYRNELELLLVQPVVRELASRLAQIKFVPGRSDEAYREDFETLKTYLM